MSVRILELERALISPVSNSEVPVNTDFSYLGNFLVGVIAFLTTFYRKLIFPFPIYRYSSWSALTLLLQAFHRELPLVERSSIPSLSSQSSSLRPRPTIFSRTPSIHCSWVVLVVAFQLEASLLYYSGNNPWTFVCSGRTIPVVVASFSH